MTRSQTSGESVRARLRRNLAKWTPAFAGVTLVAVGLYLIYPPAAFIAVGAAFLVYDARS